MKKNKYFFFTFIFMAALFSTVMVLPKKSLAEVDTVSNFQEFKQAAADPSVSEINLADSISFSSNVTLANRDVVINGQADKFFQLDTSVFTINGKAGAQTHNLRLSNIKIISSNNKLQDRPFIKAPKNWDVYANGVNYQGPVFADVANGQLVFEQKNQLHTIFENADVQTLVFEENSQYEGIAADLTKSPAFKFNGNYVNGKAAGTVNVKKKAAVLLTMAPGHTGDSYYLPAFSGKYYRLNVEEQATLKVDAAGTAIKYEDQMVYQEKPSIHVAKDAALLLNGRGGGQYPVLNLDNATTIDVQEGTFKVTGTGQQGIIKTERSGTTILLNKPKEYLFMNRKSNVPIFYAAKNTVLQILNADISVWDKIGGEYDVPPKDTWEATSLNTIIDGNHSIEVQSPSKELEEKFQMFEYGRISGCYSEEIVCPIPPTFNPVNDQDDQLTGTGNAGCEISAVNQKTGEVLGKTIVGSDNRWTIKLEQPQQRGTIIEVVQDCHNENCDPVIVKQEVSHLAAETVNYFKLGYWQEYGLILEGSIDNADWNLSDTNSVHKTLYLENDQGQIVETIAPLANTDWYQSSKYNGYQAIIVNDKLTALQPGLYKLKIGIKIDGTDVDEIHDINTQNTKYPTKMVYPGPYHQKIDEIESRDYTSTIRISTVSQGNVGYIKVEHI